MGFAINRHHVQVHPLNRLHPGEKALPERFRVDPCDHPIKGIVCGDAIRQRQKCGEPRRFAATKCRLVRSAANNNRKEKICMNGLAA